MKPQVEHVVRLLGGNRDGIERELRVHVEVRHVGLGEVGWAGFWVMLGLLALASTMGWSL